MKLIKKIIMIALILGFQTGIKAEITTEDTSKIQQFMNAETKEARAMLSSFSTSLLEEYTENYKQSLKKTDARRYWIVEEYYKRKGDETATDRLFYVFLSIILLLVLIFGLIFKIYQMQKNLEKME